MLATLGALVGVQVALAGGSSAPIVQITADGTSSVRPAWSPDGGYVASNSVIHGRLLQSAAAVLALRRLAAARTTESSSGA